jgi:hypothetical protein
MTLQSLEPQLLSLSQNEKALEIQLLAQSLGSPWRGIQKTLGVYRFLIMLELLFVRMTEIEWH